MAYETREQLIAALPTEAMTIGSFPEWTIHAVAENIWDIAYSLGLSDAQDIHLQFYEVANSLGFPGNADGT